MHRSFIRTGLLALAGSFLASSSALAHVTYTGRNFGTLVPGAAPTVITNQAVTGNFGWADGTDADFGDSHKVRPYRFTLSAAGYVTISFSASTNGGTKDGNLKPGFSVYQGLAHVAPITNAPGSPDHDTSAISLAYLASLGGDPKEGCFRALSDWRMGGDNQTGPTFDFDAADGLSTFVFKGYAVEGSSALFGTATGVAGDGNTDGTVTGSFYLPAGDYTIFVGGADYYTNQNDTTSYGLTGSVSVTPFSYTAGDPGGDGIGYAYQVTLGGGSQGAVKNHVGAWSWEDEDIFTPPDPAVGWTHTSNWVALTLTERVALTVTMSQDNSVPYTGPGSVNDLALTDNMYPSFTLWSGWDNDGDDFHTYNNHGNVDWAEDITYIDHYGNNTPNTITRTYILGPGQYTMVLGSNSTSVSTPPRQGYRASFSAASAPTVLSFTQPVGYAYAVNEPTSGSTLLSIPITRTGGSQGAVSVNVSTANGSATSTTDYTGFTDAVVNFADGASSGSIDVTINAGGGAESNETFTVNLGTTTGGATVGANNSVTVVIVEPGDTIAPSAPAITSPTANQPITLANGVHTISITGTATDNRGVGSVEVSTNNGTAAQATLATPGLASTTWSITVPVLEGTNNISVKTKDTSNKYSTATARSFKILRTLPVTVVGTAAEGSISTGFSTSSDREANKSYTIVATPKLPAGTAAGGIFVGWTLGGVDVANGNTPFTNASASRIGATSAGMTKNSLTFIFREGMTLTATFIVNPFASTTNVVAGTYNGLIKASSTLPDRPTGTDGTTIGNSTEGHFNATVQNSGAFSGKLTIDGLTLNIAGIFDDQGRARFGTAKLDTLVVARTGKPSLSVKLDLGLPGGPSLPAEGKITGEVTSTEFLKSTLAAVSTINADRAYFTGLAGAVVPDDYLTVTGTAPTPAGRTDGSFTAVIPAVGVGAQPSRVTSGGLSATDFPQGDGIATIKVTKAGLVTLSGTLADGTALAASGTLSQGLEVSLFAQLYNKLGFYSAQVKLDAAQSDSDMKTASGTEVLWSRPFISTSHYYPYGWPEVLKSDFLGAKYAVTTNKSSLTAPDGVGGDNLGDDLLAANPDGNATLTFEDGALSEALIKTVSVSTTDGVAKVPDNDPTFSLSIVRATGALSGSFLHTDDTTASFKGTLYQKGPNAGGYGYFLTKQPTVIDYTGESGGVSLVGQPATP